MRRRLAATFTLILVAAFMPAASADINPGIPIVVHWTGSTWARQSAPNATGGSALYGVLAIASSNVWAVGGHGLDSGQTQNERPLIEHWNGSQWTVVFGPSVTGGSVLRAIAKVPNGPLWAVGQRGDAQPLIERYASGHWSAVASPALPSGGALAAVAATSTSNVWATGTANGKTLIEHWNGTKWQVVASPSASGYNQLFGVAALKAGNAWAVGVSGGGGGNNPTHTLVEHWNGTKWAIVHSVDVGTQGSSLAAVSALSASNITAVGSYLNAKFCLQTLIEHWNGSRWSRVASPNAGPCDSSLLGIARSSKGQWAVGQRVMNPQSTPVTVGMILVATSSGWKVQTSVYTKDKLNELNAAAVVPATRAVWAVGVGANSGSG